MSSECHQSVIRVSYTPLVSSECHQGVSECLQSRAYRFGVQVLAVLVVVYILQVLEVLYVLQVMAVLYLFIYFIVDDQ